MKLKFHNLKAYSLILIVVVLLRLVYIKHSNFVNISLHNLYYNDYFLYYVFSSTLLYSVIFAFSQYQRKKEYIQNSYLQFILPLIALSIIAIATMLLYGLYQIYIWYGIINIIIFVLFTTLCITLLLTFHKQIIKIYNYINNLIYYFNKEALSKLWGYKILIKGSLLLISAYFAALAYMFIYSGGYYFEHQLDIFNIPSSSFNSSFLDTFDLTKSIEVFASETSTRITFLLCTR